LNHYYSYVTDTCCKGDAQFADFFANAHNNTSFFPGGWKRVALAGDFKKSPEGLWVMEHERLSMIDCYSELVDILQTKGPADSMVLHVCQATLRAANRLATVGTEYHVDYNAENAVNADRLAAPASAMQQEQPSVDLPINPIAANASSLASEPKAVTLEDEGSDMVTEQKAAVAALPSHSELVTAVHQLKQQGVTQQSMARIDTTTSVPPVGNGTLLHVSVVYDQQKLARCLENKRKLDETGLVGAVLPGLPPSAAESDYLHQELVCCDYLATILRSSANS
jgi:hypothetical protein